MRHKFAGRRLKRHSSHRRALLANLAKSLIEHEQLVTTLPKAKELRRYVEPLVTKAKLGLTSGPGAASLHKQRQLHDLLRSRSAVNKLSAVLAPRYAKRPGGYVRVLKAGYRDGDNAPMAVIEFVERDESAKGRADRERLEAQKEQSGPSA